MYINASMITAVTNFVKEFIIIMLDRNEKILMRVYMCVLVCVFRVTSSGNLRVKLS